MDFLFYSVSRQGLLLESLNSSSILFRSVSRVRSSLKGKEEGLEREGKQEGVDEARDSRGLVGAKLVGV